MYKLISWEDEQPLLKHSNLKSRNKTHQNNLMATRMKSDAACKNKTIICSNLSSKRLLSELYSTPLLLSNFWPLCDKTSNLYYLDSNIEAKFEEKWRLMERNCGGEINVEANVEEKQRRKEVKWIDNSEITHLPLFILHKCPNLMIELHNSPC